MPNTTGTTGIASSSMRVLSAADLRHCVRRRFVFTADATSWWPVESHSIHRTVSEIVFEPRAGGEVYEVSTTGEKGYWASVLEWEPPSRLVLAWNILHAEDSATEVEVRFLPDGDATRVELEHRGWERLAEAAEEKRSNYDTGWDFVLGKYVDRTP